MMGVGLICRTLPSANLLDGLSGIRPALAAAVAAPIRRLCVLYWAGL